MKELTMEQKAQRYDEIIEKAKEWYSDAQIGIVFKANLEKLFPELRESEDERIRKEIISAIKEDWPGHTDWIAWLEKQGEQKPFWSKEDENLFRCAIDAIKQESKVRTDGCLDEEVGEMVIDWLRSLKDRVQPQPKQEWSKEMGKLCLDAISLLRDYASGVDKNSQLGKKIGRADAFLSDLYHNAFYPSTYNMREDLRKSEWSEEDKYNHNIILYLLNNECVGRADKRIAIEWFKSLKERVQPNPAWCEEDRRMLIGLIDELDAIMNKATPNEISVYSKYANWLNSIKDRVGTVIIDKSHQIISKNNKGE